MIEKQIKFLGVIPIIEQQTVIRGNPPSNQTE
jgi:hypothetical protein